MRLYLVAMLAVVVTGTPAMAAGTCDGSSLVGSYAFHTEGANLGLLDASGAFHPFKEPEPFAGVGEYTFDGNGNFTRVDYNTGLGTPAFPPSPVNDQGFRTGVVGTYSVGEDLYCNICYPAIGDTANNTGGCPRQLWSARIWHHQERTRWLFFPRQQYERYTMRLGVQRGCPVDARNRSELTP